MNNNSHQPNKYDVVLGGQTPPPITGAVIGGLEGAKNRLKSSVIEHRVAALYDAIKYGEPGLDLVIEALQEPSYKVQSCAARLLQKAENIRGKHALIKYNHRLCFKMFDDWNVEEYNYKYGIKNPINTAYLVRNDISLKLLLKDPGVKSIEAIRCEIEDVFWYYRRDFRSFVNYLVEASENLQNLKALFIGDCRKHKYQKSDIGIGDISSIVEALPQLEVLHIHGNPYNIFTKSFRHNSLKTFIIETANNNQQAIKQVCSLELPALEYLELWGGRCGINIDSFAPLLRGESFPNLVCLALPSFERTDDFVYALEESPILENLTVLDLSLGTLTDIGAELLLSSPAINQLHILNVSNNCLSAKMVQILSQLNFKAIADSQSEYNSRCSGYSRDRYYALYE